MSSFFYEFFVCLPSLCPAGFGTEWWIKVDCFFPLGVYSQWAGASKRKDGHTTYCYKLWEEPQSNREEEGVVHWGWCSEEITLTCLPMTSSLLSPVVNFQSCLAWFVTIIRQLISPSLLNCSFLLASKTPHSLLVFLLHNRLFLFLLLSWFILTSMSSEDWSVPAIISIFPPELPIRISSCALDFSTWLSNRHLYLIVSQTNSFPTSSPKILHPQSARLSKQHMHTSCGSGQNLGVTFVSFFSLILHFQYICKSCRFYFPPLSRTQSFVNPFIISTILVQANIISYLDYWENLLTSLYLKLSLHNLISTHQPKWPFPNGDWIILLESYISCRRKAKVFPMTYRPCMTWTPTISATVSHPSPSYWPPCSSSTLSGPPTLRDFALTAPSMNTHAACLRVPIRSCSSINLCGAFLPSSYRVTPVPGLPLSSYFILLLSNYHHRTQSAFIDLFVRCPQLECRY